MSNRIVYLDHAATTPVDVEVADLMGLYLREEYGNPSSLYEAGRKAHKIVEEARRSVAESLSVLSEEIIFTGSGTESDNLAVLGVAGAEARRGHRHIVTSAIEHKAVLEAVAVLEKEGWEITRLPVTREGLVVAQSVAEAVRPDTALVSIMYANNEIGTVQPIREIAELIKKALGDRRPLFHTDACQAVGSLPVEPSELGVDLMTINGSKIYGPKGVGVLYVRKGSSLDPVVVGGAQEFGLRAGTENVPAIAGMALALRKITKKREGEFLRTKNLRDYFAVELKKACPEIIVNGHMEKRLPNNLHITVPDLEGESLVLELDQYGVMCATGSACTAHDLLPSHVLQAIGVSDDLIHGSLRFTLGQSNTKEDIDYTVSSFARAVERLRKITAFSNMRKK